MQWETVIGLEIHVQLATESKIFSGAATAFGAAPNSQACAVDLALPGTLPVLNREAVNCAVLFGLAIDADIHPASVFERKNYFYPDLPKGYQTSQLERPIVGAGHLDIDLDNGEQRRVRIHHAHLEEDAGKSLHEDFDGMSGIDLNRAGTPLIEIVTEPDLRSAAEAVAFLKKLHAIITTIGISDGDMSQGSMRCDANVSVRLKGDDTLGTRTELKNINSFRFVERAIIGEAQRQIECLEDGGKIRQETRLYDAERNETRPMRSKEEANDYRYFPCPDLLPVRITEADIAALRERLPELPDARAKRFVEQYGLSDYDARLLNEAKATADFFEACAAKQDDAKLVANWINGELSARLNQEELAISESPVSADQLAGLLARIKDNTISGKIAKQVFEALWQGEGADADAVIEQKGLKQVSDTGALEAMIDQVINNSPAQVDQYLAAPDDKRKKLLGYFVGQVMKLSKGQANPGLVNQLLHKKLGER